MARSWGTSDGFEERISALNAALSGIVSVEPIQEDGTVGKLSSPCVYCWQSGPVDGPPEARHAHDCEWIEARTVLDLVRHQV